MTDEAKRLLSLLMDLSLVDRLEIMDELEAAIPVPLGVWSEDDPGFKDELDRRIEEIKSGKVKGIPAEDVFSRMREKCP